MLHRLGADHVVDYTREDVTASGLRYDLIVDIADVRSVLKYRKCLRQGGRYVRIARTLRSFVGAAVLGGLITLTSGKRMGVFSWRPNRRADLDSLAQLLEQGLIDPPIDRRFGLEDTADAFRYLQSGHAAGKVVVNPS